MDVPRPIGRLHHTVLDTRTPLELAQFYSALIGMPISYRSDDWVVVSPRPDTSGLAFQLAPDHVPPRWPDPDHPQQIHFDVMVDDQRTAAAAVLALGATRLDARDDFVFADPSGHPFCLVPRPTWAPPVGSADQFHD